MHLLYRLRIKANYRDIDSFLNADINFQMFHESLTGIVSYLNFVHEAYIAKAIGIDRYTSIIENFPNHMFEENAHSRFENYISHLIR